jgi:DNA replication protein DnaC
VLMQPTIEKLHSMKLTGMLEAVRHQLEDPESNRLSFEERLALLVDRQWDWRQNKAFARRLKNAHFKMDATIEDVDYRHPRRLDRQLIRTLSGCDWVRVHHNLLVTGPCGVGKSFIACALARSYRPKNTETWNGISQMTQLVS